MEQNQEKIYHDDVLKAIFNTDKNMHISGLSGSSSAYFLSQLILKSKAPVFIIVSSTQVAEKMLTDLHFFMGSAELDIHYFPPYHISPYKRLTYNNDTAFRRIDVLYRLLESQKPHLVVTTIGALMQHIIPKTVLIEYAELLISGEEIDRDILIEKLVSGGYVRSMMVEEPGDFSIRGGILDIFTPLYPHPLRIEFFGNVVDNLRFFSATNQRRLHHVQEAIILPAKETILRKTHLTEIIARIREQAVLQNMPVTEIRKIIDRIKREGIFPGIESLIAVIYPQQQTLFDYMSSQGLYILVEPDELEQAVDRIWDQANIYFNEAISESRLCMAPDTLYLRWQDISTHLQQKKTLSMTLFPTWKTRDNDDAGNCFHFSVNDNSDIFDIINQHHENDMRLQPLVDWINENVKLGYLIYLVCSTPSQADRLASLLSFYGIEPERSDSFHTVHYGKGRIFLCIEQLSSGFQWPEASTIIITEDEIFGEKHHRRRKAKPIAPSELLTFGDLKIDDFIVHIEHGIGQYKGLEKLRLNGSTNDFLLILYKGGDKLYLPVDRMNMVQRYVGIEGVIPLVDKLGGASWDKVKRKVKKSTEKIAGELLKLYAARKVENGYAFQTGGPYYQDFEAGFTYEETADQLQTIDSVMEDMAQPIPMDRLICGDVGYGKTEVALRASFLAVNNGKQVAVLVPTTILAEQHFSTFSSRFARYPVHIECLNRFRSSSKQQKIKAGLKNGIVDIVIGTHKLLQKDIAFKDLGLVVLDEEQRFGVKDKEKLKTLRRTVDVLALTATPIPRTLHMSLLGVRDISIISTPPEHRQPIMTYISEYDDQIVAEAIQSELDRKGQIFFIHNNISSISTIAKRLKELVPHVRLGIAHGRLKENVLEQVMLQFINNEIDMLVCTTIVESGLDIPAANTIIINRADKFGLAQMYQLRGRVGRANEQAYAYLFIPRRGILGKDAQKRMKVLMEYSDLGSGFQIAMSDLKIRGGGTILGDEQSGHIAAVGYDMFLKLMAESISELKGEPVQDPLEPEINVIMSAYIPESYISDIDQRLITYRRLAKMTALEEINDFKVELVDRFGPLPVEAGNLLLKIMLKVMAVKAGVKRLDLVDQQLVLYFSESHLKNPFGFVDMISENNNIFEFTPEHVFKAKLKKGNRDSQLSQTKNILKEIAQRVNC